jgi:transcriptional regulator with XRE-family HTH domain
MQHHRTTVPALRQWRVRALLSQLDLARMAGVSPSTISLIETGKATPNYGTVRKLAAALGVSPLELAHGRPPEPAG